MNILSAYQRLRQLAPTFTTKEAATLLDTSPNYAAVLLSRLAKKNTIVHLRRGKWAYSDQMDPLLLPSILAQPMIAYVSLYTALYYHGMIDQIPSTVFAMTMAKTHLYTTPLANVSMHYIVPSLFTGYETYGKDIFLMALPEKALFDTLYLAPAKSHLFTSLVEVDMPAKFDLNLFHTWLSKVNHKSRRSSIEKKLDLIIQNPR